MNESGANEKATIQCFRCATYHTSVFNMVCAGACKCNCTTFPSWPVWITIVPLGEAITQMCFEWKLLKENFQNHAPKFNP